MAGDLTFGASRRLEVLPLAEYETDSVPEPTFHEAGIVFVDDGGGGFPVPAFSNGANWLRFDTLTPLSVTPDVPPTPDYLTQYPPDRLISKWFKRQMVGGKAKAVMDIPLTAANFVDPQVADSFGHIKTNMYVGVDSPNGYAIGTPFLALGGTYAISGDTSGIAINSGTGAITKNDPSLNLITVAGVRNITLTITDSIDGKNGDYPIQITVVNDSSNVMFVSSSGSIANDGRQPHKPRAAIDNSSAVNQRGLVLFKRGDNFTNSIVWYTGSDFAAYGDPTADIPVIRFDDSGTGNAADMMAHPNQKTDNSSYNDTSNVTFTDLYLDGNSLAKRIIDHKKCNNLIMSRCTFTGNYANSSANGVHSEGLNGVTYKFCLFKNLYSDAAYVVNCDNIYFYGCIVEPPLAGSSTSESVGDCFQSTHGGNDSERCYNILIDLCLMSQDPTSNVLKGAVVTEGSNNVTIRNSVVYGKYFGWAQAAYFSVYQNVMALDSRLPITSSSYSQAWGMGIGAQFDIRQIQCFNSYINNTANGILISGYNDPPGNWQRSDLLYMWNDVSEADRAISLRANWSGYIGDNIIWGSKNQNFDIRPKGMVTATGGEVTTKNDITVDNRVQNYAGVLCATQPTISGTVAEGETVTLTATPPVGGSITNIIWCINDAENYVETMDFTFDIPFGAALTTRRYGCQAFGANATELSCIVETTFNSPFYGQLKRRELAAFPDGLKYKAIAPITRRWNATYIRMNTTKIDFI